MRLPYYAGIDTSLDNGIGVRIYVATASDVDPSAQNGTIDNPFTDPQDAINLASLVDSSVIDFEPGEYDLINPLVMPTGFHTVVLHSNGNVIINASGGVTYDDATEGSLVLVQSGVTIEGHIACTDTGSGSNFLHYATRPSLPSFVQPLLSDGIDTSGMTGGGNILLFVNGLVEGASSPAYNCPTATLFILPVGFVESSVSCTVDTLVSYGASFVSASFAVTTSLVLYGDFFLDGAIDGSGTAAFAMLRATWLKAALTSGAFNNWNNLTIFDPVYQNKRMTLIGPDAVSTDGVLSPQTIVNGAGPFGPFATTNPTCGRQLQITVTDAGANLTSMAIHVRGTNESGEFFQEDFSIVPNGGTQVFTTVNNYSTNNGDSIQIYTDSVAGATGAETLSAGCTGIIGLEMLPRAVWPVSDGFMLKVVVNGVDETVSASINNDQRQFTPATPPDGLATYEIQFAHGS